MDPAFPIRYSHTPMHAAGNWPLGASAVGNYTTHVEIYPEDPNGEESLCGCSCCA